MSPLSTLKRYYRAAMDATKEVLIRALMGVLVFLGYVLLSLFIYAIMRRVMVPQKLHIKPVHLFFDPECQAKGFTNCPFPKAEFLMNDGKKLLSSGQYYQISLELQVPESPVNEDIGVFMVNITFYTTGRTFLSTSARPAMISYKSSLLHTLSTLFFSLPFLLGLWRQEQYIDVLLYEAYYEPYGDGSISATVSILNPRIQLYSATLTIDANFGGFTYYLYQWPITMSVIVVISIFITLCTCTVVMWVRDIMRDYDQQRRRIQRRRQAAAQQQQQQQQRGGGGGGGGGGQLRRPVVVPRPPHSPAADSSAAVPPPPPPPESESDDRATPTPSDVSASTVTGVEDITGSSQHGSALSEESSVVGDTDVEGEADVLNTLRQIGRELEGRVGAQSMRDRRREEEEEEEEKEGEGGGVRRRGGRYSDV